MKKYQFLNALTVYNPQTATSKNFDKGDIAEGTIDGDKVIIEGYEIPKTDVKEVKQNRLWLIIAAVVIIAVVGFVIYKKMKR